MAAGTGLQGERQTGVARLSRAAGEGQIRSMMRGWRERRIGPRDSSRDHLRALGLKGFGVLKGVCDRKSTVEESKDRRVSLLRSLELGDVAAIELEVAGGRQHPLHVLHEADRHERILAAPNEEGLA